VRYCGNTANHKSNRTDERKTQTIIKKGDRKMEVAQEVKKTTLDPKKISESLVGSFGIELEVDVMVF